MTRHLSVAGRALFALLGSFALIALLATNREAAAAPLPIQASNVSLPSLATVQTFTVDLGTLPARPWLTVVAVPDPTHPNMHLSIEATEWQNMQTTPGDSCPAFSSSFVSTSGPGIATLARSLNGCDPRLGAFVGRTVNIKIRVLDFGPTGGPASASVLIRGETRPPTNTQTLEVDPPFVQQQLTLPASKDTTLYADFVSGSNGAGDFLWTGPEVVLFGIPVPRRTLMAFDLDGAIQSSAIIDDADLRLRVTGIFGSGVQVGLARVFPSSGVGWSEGNANASGNEFDGAASSIPAADWHHRSRPTFAWSNPGGDVVGPILDTATVAGTGPLTFSSTALTSAVQTMVSNSDDVDGFLVAGPETSPLTAAVQLASRSHPSASIRPALDVAFTPTEVFESGSVATTTVSFISEGQNFRWIYDLDQDDVLVTNIGGVCEVTDTSSPHHLPYTYQYGGTPGFVGVDCCTWRIEAASSVVGTGQALFFHNLDTANPANMPPDFDEDGIRNLCDNCVNVPNGPLGGSCLGGPTPRAPCHSNLDCGSGGACSLSQEDSNGDFVGNACVPEPGFAAGIGSGCALLAVSARIHRPRRGRSGGLLPA